MARALREIIAAQDTLHIRFLPRILHQSTRSLQTHDTPALDLKSLELLRLLQDPTRRMVCFRIA